MHLSETMKMALKLIYERADIGRPITDIDVKNSVLSRLILAGMIELQIDGSYRLTTQGEVPRVDSLCRTKSV